MSARWSIPFDVIAERTNKRLDQVIRASAIMVFARVVERSPVDTGRFRANWNVSYGAPDTNTSANTDPSGGAKLQEVSQALLSYPIGGVFYLCNSLPYAQVLEYGLYPNPPQFGSKKRGENEMTIHTVNGYSMQAPQGMVRITAVEFAAAVRALVQKG